LTDRTLYEVPERNIRVIDRRSFVAEFGKNYKPGQHVTLLGPSGRGKTRLTGQLLLSVRQYHPEITAVILHGKIKGRDLTIEHLSKASGYPIGSHYPLRGLRARQQMRKSRGMILRPLNSPMDTVKEENEALAKEYKSAIHRGYQAPRKKPIILVADEAHQTHNDLRLMSDCEGPLMRGRPVCSMWSLVQRGRFVSYHVYDQAEHVFIFYDPDRDNQRRYSEIGDVDARELVELTRQLKTKTVADGSTISEALYFRRSGNQLAIVGI
jgi:hypothetical protein